MADPTERSVEKTTSSLHVNHHTPSGEESGRLSRPTGWMYRSFRVGPIRLPWYASPPSQLILVALVCFLCPGMFNAVSGLGGGGQVNATTANNANVALYSTFSVVGFFAGSIANRLGIKLTLSFGGFGYFLYIASFLSYNHTKNAGFVIFAGALLGVCAGLLWTAQGAIMVCHCLFEPTEIRLTPVMKDVVPSRGLQRTLHLLVLDDLQPRLGHWELGKLAQGNTSCP